MESKGQRIKCHISWCNSIIIPKHISAQNASQNLTNGLPKAKKKTILRSTPATGKWNFFTCHLIHRVSHYIRLSINLSSQLVIVLNLKMDGGMREFNVTVAQIDNGRCTVAALSRVQWKAHHKFHVLLVDTWPLS